VDTLLGFTGVMSVMMVAGRYDFFVQYVCQNMEEYREFIGEDLRNVPGIADIESFIGVDLYVHKFELGILP
jgi:DNA-binding Lrp family transcriptional regulator